MKCTKARKLLIAETCQALDGTVSEALRAHLESCDECREQLREVRSLGEMFASARPPVAPARPDLWERIDAEIERTEISKRRSPWLPAFWRMGTATAAAALVLVAFNLTLNEPRSSTPEVKSPVSKPMEAVRPELPTTATKDRPVETTSAPEPARTAVAAESGPREKAPKRAAANALPTIEKKTPQLGFASNYGRRGDDRTASTASVGEAIGPNADARIESYGLRSTNSDGLVGESWDDKVNSDARTAGAGVHRAAAAPSAEPARGAGDLFATTEGTLSRGVVVDDHDADHNWYFDRASVALADRVEAKHAERIMEEKARAVEMVYSSADSRARTLFSY